jgi:hypothetical protein
MRWIIVSLVTWLLFCLPAFAQDPALPQDFVAAGVAWNQYAAPQISGNLLYARQISNGTYSFTMIDVISKSIQPFTVATSISTGVGQHIRTIGRARVFLVTTVGIMAGGTDVGYSWTGGGAVAIGLGKGWNLVPSVRVLKGSLTDFQYIGGLAIGWGK